VVSDGGQGHGGSSKGWCPTISRWRPPWPCRLSRTSGPKGCCAPESACLYIGRVCRTWSTQHTCTSRTYKSYTISPSSGAAGAPAGGSGGGVTGARGDDGRAPTGGGGGDRPSSGSASAGAAAAFGAAANGATGGAMGRAGGAAVAAAADRCDWYSLRRRFLRPSSRVAGDANPDASAAGAPDAAPPPPPRLLSSSNRYALMTTRSVRGGVQPQRQKDTQSCLARGEARHAPLLVLAVDAARSASTRSLYL
jgi:hypothetical protein